MNTDIAKAGNSSSNRLELLLFRLNGEQLFGINVLKMQEVIPCPPLTQVPQAHPTIIGIAHLRGVTMSIIDLSAAIGNRRLVNNENNLTIIAEFNRRIQGFLIRSVDKIIIRDWNEVYPPPRGTTNKSYLSGVIDVDGTLVEILDIERILVEVLGIDPSLHSIEKVDSSNYITSGQQVLIVDDSTVALKQTSRTLDEINVPHLTARDGTEALKILNDYQAITDTKITDSIPMVISDIEMPKMDGYTLVENIRKTSSMDGIYILLHTSLNGSINVDMAKKCGANDILEKFVPEELAAAVIRGLTDVNNRG
jgi:two-component system, chemotaxis family, chemotaxis protein CheV